MGRLITALPALLYAVAGIWAIAHAIRGDRNVTRRDIRRIEAFANHPANRKEKPQP